MSSSVMASPKRKSHAMDESPTLYRSGRDPVTSSPIHGSSSRRNSRGASTMRGSPGRHRSSPVRRLSSASSTPAGGATPTSASPSKKDATTNWSEYTLLREMTSLAELNQEVLSKLEHLEHVVSNSERSCAVLAEKREDMERELLDWKNLLVQKVEGCYTQILGQLLDAFEGLEGDAVLNREYVSNMLWSTKQLCGSSKEALQTPDLDTLGVLNSRLCSKLAQIESLNEDDLELREDASDWSYTRPEIGDDVIWRLMGTFELGPTGLDSTSATPVTTPCGDHLANYPSIIVKNQELLGAFQNSGSSSSGNGRPTGLPIASVNVITDDAMDENLNINVTADPDSPYALKLLGAFQTRTVTDVNRCHPISLALSPTSGELIVPDKHNKKVKIFTQKGELVREITHDDLRSPTYVAVTPEGDVAVCDRKAGDIKVFSMQGDCLSIIPKLFKSPAGIAFTSTGDLLVADTGRKAVHVVSLQAATIKSTIRHFKVPVPGSGCKEDELSQLQWPHCISVTRDDIIVVSDRTSDLLQMLDVSGRSIGRYGSPGAGKGRLQSPYGTAIAENGDILVCDYSNHTLQVLTSNGQWGEPLLTSGQGLQFPAGVVWLSANKMAVSEYLSGIVKIYELQANQGNEDEQINADKYGQSENSPTTVPRPRPMSPIY